MQLTEAVNLAIHEKMTLDKNVIYLGEDVESALRGFSKGLIEEFGTSRVRECPISEQGFVGVGIGTALNGSRSIIDLQISSLVYIAFDQIVNQALKLPQMLGGNINLPITFIIPCGSRRALAGQHSDNPYSLLLHMGMECYMPSTVNEAYHLTKRALLLNKPSAIFVPVHLMGISGEINKNQELNSLDFDMVSQGDKVTVITNGSTCSYVKEIFQERNNSSEVDHINISCLNCQMPEIVIQSANKTKKLVVIDDSNEKSGWGESIIAQIVTHVNFSKCRVHNIARKGYVVPFAWELEQEVIVQKNRIKKLFLCYGV
jgi:pyruvate dehydrogenase E1 component beta subunit